MCRPCVCQRWGLVAGFDGGTIANGSETLSREFAMVKRCIETEMERRLFDIKYRLSCSDNFAYFNYYMYFERKINYK